MEDEVLGRIRAAYAALATGDVDSFAEVLDDEVHWRGVPRGWFRKKHSF
jgi:ketosteroid isomerase-like protein